jgi:hypothetical protein
MATPKQLGNDASEGWVMGKSSASLLGFYGLATGIAKPQLSAAAAVATTAPINSSISSSCFGFTSAQASALIALANALRAQQIALGLAAT